MPVVPLYCLRRIMKGLLTNHSPENRATLFAVFDCKFFLSSWNEKLTFDDVRLKNGSNQNLVLTGSKSPDSGG